MYSLLHGYAGAVVEELNALREDHDVEVIETVFEGAKYMRCLVFAAPHSVAKVVKPKKAPAIK